METPWVETFIFENSQKNSQKYYKSNLLWSCICLRASILSHYAIFLLLLELFWQCGIFLLVVGTFLTVWYFSIGFGNCSESDVFFLFSLLFYINQKSRSLYTIVLGKYMRMIFILTTYIYLNVYTFAFNIKLIYHSTGDNSLMC